MATSVSVDSSECTLCEKACYGTHKCILCSKCTKPRHLKCVNLKRMQASKIENDVENINYCNNCISDALPFQSISNVEFSKIMQTATAASSNKANCSKGNNTADCNDLHILSPTINQSCNYRSVEWLANQYFSTSKQSFNLIHCNVRSLPKNKNKIEELLQIIKIQPDILAISESKLNNNNKGKASLINYTMVHCDSLSNAGGVALYVSNSLEFHKIDEYSFASSHSETLFIEVKIKNSAKGLVIGVIYRYPSSSLSDFQIQFTQTLNDLTKHKKDYIICGSFNIDLLKSPSSTSINEYINSVFSEGCYCAVDKPTRITSHSSTLIDHLYSNILNKTLTSNILQYEISDHLPLTCSVFLKPDRNNNVQTYRCTTNFNCDNFVDDVCCLADRLSIDLASTTRNFNLNLDNICTNFIVGFSEIVNEHAPLKTFSKRQRKQKLKPWITKAILKSIKTKNRLYNKCYKQDNPELIAHYKKYLNKLTSIKRLAKERYYTSQLLKHKQDVTKLWTIINELLDQSKRCSNTTIHKLTTIDNKYVESQSEISNILNDYFVNVGANLSAKADIGNFSTTKLNNSLSSNVHSCFFQPVVPLEVHQVIQNLNSKKAAGPENILIKYYKLASEWIANFLSKYFNKCIEHGYFPSALKLAKVNPVFKSGKHSLMNNYRPISLLSPLTKVFEKLISTRLTKFLEKIKFLQTNN